MEGDGCGKEQGFRDRTMDDYLIFTNTTQCKFFFVYLEITRAGFID